ncbi:DUF5947 family protein [Actinoplanes sp. NBC_00393]|uniref:DUF5947 family protein n=1 Tax=Actinoplanes sp. NBC_00393 TaxID=2975953 RepID=UPI002E22269F
MTDPLAALRRAARARPAEAEAAPRCDMCAAPITPEHRHVVDLHRRSLMCTCTACHLLFTDEHAQLRYRAVPDRHLALTGAALDDRAWDELQIPVGLAFLFRNSSQDRMVACYPGPAGATESELPLAAWDRIVEGHPVLRGMLPDVEALLVGRDAGSYLVPIDVCYELTGALRTRWRGFDGGREAHEAMDAFFTRLRARSRVAPDEGGDS